MPKDEDIRRLVKSTYKPAAPSPEFRERLLEELREEASKLKRKGEEL